MADDSRDPLIARLEDAGLGSGLARAERHADVAALPAAARLRWLKRIARRLLRFHVQGQSEFNAGVLSALHEAEQALRRTASRAVGAERAAADAERAAAERLGVVERFQGEILRRIEAIETHLVRMQADIERHQHEWAQTVSGGLGRLESTLHAQGRHLDDLAGHVVHLADEQRDVLDVGVQVPRLAEDLRARIHSLERVLRPDVDLDHFDFARRFRGDPALIKKRLQIYARLFGDVRRVLDLGCGRGEFLEACTELGIGAYGVDSDPSMVSYCQLRGFEVGLGDALAHLAQLEGRSLDGLFSAQVVEHLTTPELVDLVQLAAVKLKRGALFIAETINPDTFSALRWFYMDLTHRQPIPSATLQFLLEEAGFVVRDVLYSSPLEEGEKLTLLAAPDEAAAGAQRELIRVYNQNVEKLNDLLYGPQDYAVIAER
jgi:2-polyprenyl-3-methyl-5-hydroxy-6-metoxy-1,4-benzoquinol methylase